MRKNSPFFNQFWFYLLFIGTHSAIFIGLDIIPTSCKPRATLQFSFNWQDNSHHFPSKYSFICLSSSAYFSGDSFSSSFFGSFTQSGNFSCLTGLFEYLTCVAVSDKSYSSLKRSSRIQRNNSCG